MGSLLINHYHFHAHGLRYDEDIGEDDSGIDESGKALDRLNGNGRCDFGVPTALEEVAFALGFMILWEITPGFIPMSANCSG
jgi:hypothetical protein